MSFEGKNRQWAGNTQPSLPEPLRRVKLISFKGFCWTDGGMAHDIDETAIEMLRIPPYAPASMNGSV